MINKINKAIALLLIVSSFFLAIPTAMADTAETLGELKAEYQAKLDEQAKNEQMTEEAKAQIARNEALIDDAEQKIHEAEGEMEVAQQNIDASNERIAGLTEEANNVLLYLQQMQSQNAYVEYVSGATTITEMITRIAAVEQISDHIQTTMKNLEEEIKKNEELKVELEKKKQKLEQQQVEYQNTINSLYDDIAEYDKYALDIDTQVASLKDKLDSAEDMCAKWAPEKGDDAIINVDCVEPVYDENGNIISIINTGWLKPLNSGRITSEIGYRWGSYHNALDIGGNAEGTPVYAAAAGVVSGKVSRYRCGGNMLYIDVNVNGVAYTTYYYHLLSFAVDIGDVVTTDTVIGYVGGSSTSTTHGGYDSCTTGAHLHFGVALGYYNGYSVPSSNVITPPGFPNQYGWRFYTRYQMYG